MKRLNAFLFQFSSPKTFYPLAGKLIPWFVVSAGILTVLGLVVSFYLAPTDAKQGEVYRVIFIHVPTSIMSMFVYVIMAGYAALYLIFNTRLSDMMAHSLAPTGAGLTFLALWTGSLWGKPTWGTYWVWDARVTSELILLFLFVGYISLRATIDDRQRAAKASALLAIVGVVNVPIIYFSVIWWNTLHQGPSVNVAKGTSALDPTIGWGMLVMLLALWCYVIAISLMRVRAIIMEEKQRSTWIREFEGH